MYIDEAIQSALKYLQAGDLQKAENVLSEIIQKQPDNITVLNLLGLLHYQLQKYNSAIDDMKKLINLDQNNFQAYFIIGHALQKKGQFGEAIIYYQEALKLNPDIADVYYNLGTIYQGEKQFDKAVASYQKALQINPDYFEAYHNLGIVFLDRKEFNDALLYLQKALQLNPDIFSAYYNLGLAFQETGNLNKAIEYYQKAIQFNPSDAEAYDNLGTALHEMERIDEAIGCYQKAIQFNPDLVEAYNNLGIAFLIQGKQDEALSAYDKALEYYPNNIKTLWLRCMSQLLVIYPTEASIEITRRRYSDELQKLKNSICLSTPHEIEAAAETVGKLQPFYLAYQGLNDRELQQVYGDLVSEIMAKRYPQFADRPSMPCHEPYKPLRLGIVSKFFSGNSIWKLYRGWIENLNKKRFSIYGYYTGRKKDSETEISQKSLYQFRDDVCDFEKLCETIRGDSLHVLIFPEIGMDPVTLRLASLRLAPVQCTAWLHPETSGLPTIDYYLSSDLMEPSGADDHYTEQLIRLPNLSIYYTPIEETPTGEIKRDIFGISQKDIIYNCCQNLSKYLPQHDEVFPLIARQAGDCKFLFVSSAYRSVTEQFSSRIKKVFNHFNLNADDYVLFSPRLDPKRFRELNSLADIYLDSIGWSGGATTLEAIAYNIPIVTFRGELMRGRHSSAILDMMGLTETIADSNEDYVELAIKLGRDQEWRHYISKKIEENKHIVYRDRKCIDAFEDFLESVVKTRMI